MNSAPRKLLVAFALSCLTIPAATPTVMASMEDSPKVVIDEVWQIVYNEYVDKNFNQTDWAKVRQELLSKDYSTPEQGYKAIRTALKKLNDPYTRFLEPKDFENLTDQTSGEVSGVGVKMQVDQETQQLVVVEPLENSPAAKAGIQAGDKIVKINGKLTSLMSVEQASDEIKGPEGSKLTMEIQRSGKGIFPVELVRERIELPSVTYNLKQEGNLKVGYIRLDEFSGHAAEQMKKAIQNLSQQGATGFVLDLRGNPGGLLFASIEIARMWMKEGAIVHTVDRKGGDREFAANNTAITNLPLVVLVDENSASASEILAAALKENQRATLVGTRTFGKATVQSVHSLSDGSGLAVTISRYYPPSRINISKKGVIPDVDTELTPEVQERLLANPRLVATEADPQYQQAIVVLKTPPRQPISIR